MSDSKSSILANIRSNFPKQKIEYPTIPTYTVPGKDLLQTFQENALVAGASFYKVNNVEEAQEIAQKLYPDAKVICSATDEWAGNKDWDKITQPQDMEDVDVAIVRTHLGVAEMGMVWLTEEDLRVNSLGFLCQNIIVLLDPKDISENMHTAYPLTHLEKHNYGCFVMGPSATADIGAVLVRGAQGPRSLVIFFLEKN